jgi:glutamine amidotransferase
MILTTDADAIRLADRIVLPGQGIFGECMAGLAALPGVVPVLKDVVLARGRPFLGICVGMQLLADRSLEHGVHPGLGWIEGEIRRLTPADEALKVPHMGWNELALRRSDHPLLAGIAEGDHAYFVHSYHLHTGDRDLVLAEAEYGGPFVAMIARDNIAGTQFHPEKSQRVGLRLLTNFLTWRP